MLTSVAQDQGSANVLLSNVSISIDWVAAVGNAAAAAAAAAASNDRSLALESECLANASVVVKIGDVNLKFASSSPRPPPLSPLLPTSFPPTLKMQPPTPHAHACI